jgi:copper(I)-binding protein
MEHSLKTKAMIAAASALLLAATLGACGQSTKTAGEEKTGQAAAPDAKPGLSVSDARLVLPTVTGNPGAAYFSLANGSDKETELAAVHVDGAGSAEIHDMSGGAMNLAQGVTLAAGETVKFAPGGKHVMVFDLEDSVKAGGTTEMTLTFADGDKLSAPVKVETVSGSGGEEQAP